MRRAASPQGYLSHSQKVCWRKNPEAYIRRYFYGEKQFETEYMRFGKELADKLEREDASIAHLLAFMHRPEKREHEIRVKIGRLPLLIKMDGYGEEKILRVDEHKSGLTEPFDKTDNVHQRRFYCAALHAVHKRLPDEYITTWLKTQRNPDTHRLELEGTIETRNLIPTMEEVLQEVAEAQQTWEEITAAYKVATSRVFA